MREKIEDRKISGTIDIALKDSKGNIIGHWRDEKAIICKHIVETCQDFTSRGYRMTLRQLYYQLVGKDLIPNHITVYAKISSIKDDLVYAGYLDWETFEDRGRIPHISYHEKDIPSALEKTLDFYNLNKQLGQETLIEVWTEKDAISSLLKMETDAYTVRTVINKGYSSSTAMYQAYKRFAKNIEEGKKVVILYFGDHDPSGLDMIRDIEERTLDFLCKGSRMEDFVRDWFEKEGIYTDDLLDHYFDEIGTTEVDRFYKQMRKDYDDWSDKDVRRFDAMAAKYFLDKTESFKVIPIGLTYEQVLEYNLPPNPAKVKDPRAKAYMKKFGSKSWEVDALDPDVIRNIVKSQIEAQMNMDQYNEVMERERKELAELKVIVKNSYDR